MIIGDYDGRWFRKYIERMAVEFEYEKTVNLYLSFELIN